MEVKKEQQTQPKKRKKILCQSILQETPTIPKEEVVKRNKASYPPKVAELMLE